MHTALSHDYAGCTQAVGRLAVQDLSISHTADSHLLQLCSCSCESGVGESLAWPLSLAAWVAVAVRKARRTAEAAAATRAGGVVDVQQSCAVVVAPATTCHSSRVNPQGASKETSEQLSLYILRWQLVVL
jgi:hypothetical protein